MLQPDLQTPYAGTDPTAERVLAGDIRAAARLISRVEAGDSSAVPALRALYRRSGKALVVGISGPPGAGKSTLLDQLISLYRGEGLRVAVVAVDPSSPFSGGAVLGDRVRMAQHATDRDVFIRSLAARGALGGVTAATGDVLTIFDAMGWDVILLETVGVGQNEVEVMRQVPTVVMVQNPGDGDAVQSVKAGALEIAHIFTVNKADMPGAEKVARQLQEMLATRTHTAAATTWNVPVVLTEATSGRGIAELAQAIAVRHQFLLDHPQIARDEARTRLRARVVDLSSVELRRQLSAVAQAAGSVSEMLEQALDRQADPYEVSVELIERLGSTTRRIGA